jgi:hypothetical protein
MGSSSCDGFGVSNIREFILIKLWPQIRYHGSPSQIIMKSILALFFAAVMWVQVPQWKDDWSKCAIDVPDASCHWYIVAPDSTFGVGFNWEIAPWFDAHGLNDIAELDNTMENIHQLASTES